MKSIPIIILVCLFPLINYGQSKTATIEGDCSKAVEITPTGKYIFKESPRGHGKILEYNHNPLSSIYYFNQENNSAWFTFVSESSNFLSFTIQPKDSLADFDFLLYAYTNSSFCQDVKNKKVKPIRSNISRFNPSERGATGLSAKSKKEFIPAGPGANYSSPIQLKPGVRYYLVINESNNIQTPFYIKFSNNTTSRIVGKTVVNGTLVDSETKKPIPNAIISVEKPSGEIIMTTKSDPKTGKYSLVMPEITTNAKQPYIIVTEKEGYFYSEKNIKVNKYERTIPINTVLPLLKKGNKTAISNIHFYGNEAITLDSSKPSMNRLLKLMRKNKSLFIEISGHTNGCDKGSSFSQKLSEARANTIQRFLVTNGIDAARMSTIGYGCSQMLFPTSDTESQQQQNRRVEIKVTGL